MNRRGFLAALVAAPVVPLVAKAEGAPVAGAAHGQEFVASMGDAVPWADAMSDMTEVSEWVSGGYGPSTGGVFRTRGLSAIDANLGHIECGSALRPDGTSIRFGFGNPSVPSSHNVGDRDARR